MTSATGAGNRTMSQLIFNPDELNIEKIVIIIISRIPLVY